MVCPLLQDFIDFRTSRNKMLRSRKNQILLSFSFWPQLEPREGPNIYEMRSYTLKVGTNTDIVPVNYISPREAETTIYKYYIPCKGDSRKCHPQGCDY